MEMDIVRAWGFKLLQTHLKLVTPIEFVRQHSVNKWRLVDAMNPLKIHKNVLWMCIMETQTGKRSATGNRWFTYVKFWKDFFPKGKRYYRFRSLIGDTELIARRVGNDVWEIRGF